MADKIIQRFSTRLMMVEKTRQRFGILLRDDDLFPWSYQYIYFILF
jgi:hypothetical protein